MGLFYMIEHINNPPSVRAIGLSSEVIDTNPSYSIITLNRMRQIVPSKQLMDELIQLMTFKLTIVKA